MPDAEPSPIPLSREDYDWLRKLADARFGGDVGAAAAAVIRAARLTAWKPNRVDPPTDRWER